MNSCTPRAISTGVQATAPTLPSCRKSQAGPPPSPRALPRRAAGGPGAATGRRAASVPRRRAGLRPVPLRHLGAATGALLAQPAGGLPGLRRPGRRGAPARADRRLPAQRARPALRGGTGDRHPWRAAGHPPVRPGVARERRSGGCGKPWLPRGAPGLAATGAVPHGIDLDAEGLRSDRLAGIAGCRLAYVTPSHQYPTGVTLCWRGAWSCWRGRARRRLDRRGRLRRRVSLQRYAAGAAGRAGPTGPGALRRDLLQDRLPGVAPGLPGGPAGAGRAFRQRRAIEVRHSEVGTQRVMADFIAEGISSATSAACAAPPAPAATPCCGLARGAGCQPLPAVEAGLHLCVRVDSLARSGP